MSKLLKVTLQAEKPFEINLLYHKPPGLLFSFTLIMLSIGLCDQIDKVQILVNKLIYVSQESVISLNLHCICTVNIKHTFAYLLA
jgi:hypothetical protein